MTTDLTNQVANIADALLNTQSDAIIATDKGGMVTHWNPGAERVFGWTAHEALGGSLDLIIPERLREPHWKGFHEVMRTGRSRYTADQMLSVPALTKDRGRISVEFTLSTIADETGSVTGTVAILRDVTPTFEELKRLRRAVAGRD